ncbi:hypothetical protein DL546_003490 [Coniochaeta pulveracea]|uniref:Uncharacterized protein n=1 Tax=Coniochaeta pulveracea TaxID=177199 RepID=A0A420XZC1_9PEZI|nr:hypothetical protein DL546_003490 [Coniochaeta pulveracea]
MAPTPTKRNGRKSNVIERVQALTMRQCGSSTTEIQRVTGIGASAFNMLRSKAVARGYNPGDRILEEHVMDGNTTKIAAAMSPNDTLDDVDVASPSPSARKRGRKAADDIAASGKKPRRAAQAKGKADGKAPSAAVKEVIELEGEEEADDDDEDDEAGAC